MNKGSSTSIWHKRVHYCPYHGLYHLYYSKHPADRAYTPSLTIEARQCEQCRYAGESWADFQERQRCNPTANAPVKIAFIRRERYSSAEHLEVDEFECRDVDRALQRWRSQRNFSGQARKAPRLTKVFFRMPN